MKRLLCILLTAMLLSLAACGGFARETTPAPTTESMPADVLAMNELENGGLYVRHTDGSYQKLYMKNANYDAQGSVSTQANDRRILWFQDDLVQVPTMYLGDELIFKTDQPLDENFYFERFQYIGYTVGISGLTTVASGRRAFIPTADKVNPGSDAEKLLEFGQQQLIIDRFNGLNFKELNVSNGGCVLDLVRDQEYEMDVYVGSYLNRLTVKADSQALCSMAAYHTINYDFLQSQILRIRIPDFYNTGYYLVNGFGLIRYVKGTSYDDTTDFNVPNEDLRQDDLTAVPSSNEYWQIDRLAYNTPFGDEMEKTEVVTFEQDGLYQIHLRFSPLSTMDPTPYATLTDENGVETEFTKGAPVYENDVNIGDSAYHYWVDGWFRAGTYRMLLGGLSGRLYSLYIMRTMTDPDAYTASVEQSGQEEGIPTPEETGQTTPATESPQPPTTTRSKTTTGTPTRTHETEESTANSPANAPEPTETLPINPVNESTVYTDSTAESAPETDSMDQTITTTWINKP